MKQNYTFDAIRINNKFPLLVTVAKQVFFWIIAYGVLGSVLYFSTLSNLSALKSEYQVGVTLVIFMIVLNGMLHGLILGLLQHLINRKQILNQSLGLNILLGSIGYFLIITGLIALTGFILSNLPGILKSEIFLTEVFSVENWKYNYASLLIYTLFMTSIINFITQMGKKFGPGYLLPFLFGKFRYPREEERIFMFLDLDSSTTLAEKLGHINYSRLIQECFLDINKIVGKYHGEIYQYVGDQIVITWPVESLGNFTSVDFFFTVKDLLISRKDYYLRNFDIVPAFKAGAHIGVVTMVEVGDIKRDIAYHGDTLNVAARLESLCNELNQPLLISAALKDRVMEKKYTMTSFGYRNLKGRSASIEVFGISQSI